MASSSSYDDIIETPRFEGVTLGHQTMGCTNARRCAPASTRSASNDHRTSGPPRPAPEPADSSARRPPAPAPTGCRWGSSAPARRHTHVEFPSVAARGRVSLRVAAAPRTLSRRASARVLKSAPRSAKGSWPLARRAGEGILIVCRAGPTRPAGARQSEARSGLRNAGTREGSRGRRRRPRHAPRAGEAQARS